MFQTKTLTKLSHTYNQPTGQPDNQTTRQKKWSHSLSQNVVQARQQNYDLILILILEFCFNTWRRRNLQKGPRKINTLSDSYLEFPFLPPLPNPHSQTCHLRSLLREWWWLHWISPHPLPPPPCPCCLPSQRSTRGRAHCGRCGPFRWGRGCCLNRMRRYRLERCSESGWVSAQRLLNLRGQSGRWWLLFSHTIQYDNHTISLIIICKLS